MAFTLLKPTGIDLSQTFAFTGSVTGVSSNSFGYWSTTGYKATKHSGNTTFNDETTTTVAFSNEDYDNGNNYNTSTYKYVVPATGRYFFTFNISIVYLRYLLQLQ